MLPIRQSYNNASHRPELTNWPSGTRKGTERERTNTPSAEIRQFAGLRSIGRPTAITENTCFPCSPDRPQIDCRNPAPASTKIPVGLTECTETFEQQVFRHQRSRLMRTNPLIRVTPRMSANSGAQRVVGQNDCRTDKRTDKFAVLVWRCPTTTDALSSTGRR